MNRIVLAFRGIWNEGEGSTGWYKKLGKHSPSTGINEAHCTPCQIRRQHHGHDMVHLVGTIGSTAGFFRRTLDYLIFTTMPSLSESHIQTGRSGNGTHTGVLLSWGEHSVGFSPGVSIHLASVLPIGFLAPTMIASRNQIHQPNKSLLLL